MNDGELGIVIRLRLSTPRDGRTKQQAKRKPLTSADLAEEDRKRLDEVFVQAPGGTVAPRAWNGWRAGREFEDRKRQRGQEEVSFGFDIHLSQKLAQPTSIGGMLMPARPESKGRVRDS